MLSKKGISKKIIITRPWDASGVGSNLLSLIGALYLAEKTHRDLVVDWRGLQAMNYSSINFFPQYFQEFSRWNNTEIFYSTDEIPYYDPANIIEHSIQDCFDLLGGKDCESEFYIKKYHGYLVLKNPQLTAGQKFHFCRSVFSKIQPNHEVQSLMDTTINAHNIAGNYLLCAVVRTGVGYNNDSFAMSDKNILNRISAFKKNITRSLPKEFRDNVKILVVTDSEKMHRYLMDGLENSFSVINKFAPPNVHGVHLPASQWGIKDFSEYENWKSILANMFLMGRCQAMIGNHSTYNSYAYYVSNGFNGKFRGLDESQHSLARLLKKIQSKILTELSKIHKN